MKDLGETIQLNKRILENNTLKHAFAAHLELENSYKPPKFEYQAKVLYMAIFSFISLPPLKKFMRKLDFLGDWVATRRPQSSYPPSTESFLSKEFVKELESTINSEVLFIKEQRETHLVIENDKYWVLGVKLGIWINRVNSSSGRTGRPTLCTFDSQN